QGCPLRTKCLRKPETTRSRQVAVLTRKAEPTHSQRMRERIDSAWGRDERHKARHGRLGRLPIASDQRGQPTT
ncbi:MAG: hypothetical protein ACTHJ9_07515, partial [Rhodanobacter sp.]